MLQESWHIVDLDQCLQEHRSDFSESRLRQRQQNAEPATRGFERERAHPSPMPSRQPSRRSQPRKDLGSDDVPNRHLSPPARRSPSRQHGSFDNVYDVTLERTQQRPPNNGSRRSSSKCRRSASDGGGVSTTTPSCRRWRVLHYVCIPVVVAPKPAVHSSGGLRDRCDRLAKGCLPLPAIEKGSLTDAWLLLVELLWELLYSNSLFPSQSCFHARIVPRSINLYIQRHRPGCFR